MSVRGSLVALALCCVLATVFDTAGEAPTAFRSLSGQVILTTVATLSALTVAYLALGRFRQRGLLRDLLLCASFTVIGLSNLLFSLMPAMSVAGILGTNKAAPIVAGVFAAALFAAAAFLGDRRVEEGGASRALVGASATVAVTLVLGWVIGAGIGGGSLGTVVAADKFMSPSDPSVFALELGGAVLYAVATVGWWLQAERSRDWFSAALALAGVLAVFSRLNFIMATSVSSNRMIAANVFRLGFYVVLLVGSAHEIGGYWSQRAELARLQERRRIARDLHDGLAQELGYAARRARLLEAPGAHSLSSALERALDESRRAIAALSRPLDDPVDIAVARTAEEVAARFGARVRFDLASGIRLTPEVRESLLRITREAVANAARHADARNIVVRLSNHTGTTLSISDDGCGFEPGRAAEEHDRFGLISMRERAETLRGRFTLSSEPGRGTTVSVWVP